MKPPRNTQKHPKANIFWEAMKLLPVGSRIFQAISLNTFSATLADWKLFAVEKLLRKNKKDKPGFPTKCQCLLFSPNRFKLHTDACYVTIPNNGLIVSRCIYILLLCFTVIMNINKEERKTISYKHSRISEIL